MILTIDKAQCLWYNVYIEIKGDDFINNLKPSEILNIKKVGDLFSDNPLTMKTEYKHLVKLYHPDLNKTKIAKDVFIHIQLLYKKAIELQSINEWESSNSIKITTFKNESVNYVYLKEKVFELGKMYICKNRIIYVIEKKNKKFYDNAISQIKNIKYSNKDFEKEFSRCLPKINSNFETNNGDWCIIINKTEDIFCLSDLITFYKGKIPIKHSAWIISRLNNLCCFLQFSNLVHNGINIENCFVSPSFHSVLLLGGWWYCTKEDSKMIGTTREIYSAISSKTKTDKKSRFQTDLESVKLIGKKSLNSSYKSEFDFKQDKTIPKEIFEFICGGTGLDAVEEFKKWDLLLDKAFGKRTFIKMEVSEEDIYK